MITKETIHYTLTPKTHTRDANGKCWTTHYVMGEMARLRGCEHYSVTLPCKEHPPLSKPEPPPSRDTMPHMKGIIHLVWLMAELCDICHTRKPEICAVKQTEKYGLVPMWICPECADKVKVGEEHD